MVTLKASVAAAILIGAVSATAGATYAVTRMSVAVSCPAASAAAEQPSSAGWGHGAPVPMDQGKKY